MGSGGYWGKDLANNNKIFRILQQHHHQTTPPLPSTTSSRTTMEQNTAQQWKQQQSSPSSRQDGRAFAWNPQAAPYQPLAGEEDDDQQLLLDEQQQQQWQAAAWYTGWEQQPQQQQHQQQWEQQQQGYEQPAITHPHHFGVPSFSLPPPSTTTEPFTAHDMSAWLNQVSFWTALMREAAAAASTAGDSNGANHTMPPYQQYQPEYQPEDLLHFQQQQQHQPHHHQEDEPDITRCLPAWLISAVQTSLPLQLEYVVQYENQADDDSNSRVDRFLASSWRQGLAESRWEGSWQGSSEPHERYDGVDYYSEPSDEHHRRHQQQQGMRRRGYVRPRVATEADKKNADDDDAEGMWLDLGDVDRMRWSGLMNAIRGDDDDDDDEADPGAERRRPFATLAEWERNWPIPDGDAIWGMYWG
ncbi:uncharacterized protein LTHEOB_7555 [Lasiodiplodia theobromae]|uniref:uncharacterized protein n=1 Tax=Lasiodiplodia theobromae TaxID=45133 RepID=UPI0015C3FF24|nr:uncharacterized protein LTHEOB_7555 [Lasiodiplodia theobromae]KAF4542363.1 hypothetical protein LTHEOB_7555 [Lasiodiplodia theobromae]